MSDPSTVTARANPYSTLKLVHHPDRIEAFRRGEVPAPVLVHLMWQNLCPQDCHWCSFRMSNWKNSQLFDDRQHVPWGILEPTLRWLAANGTKAIELTGGGEPTVYPHFDRGLELIDTLGLDFALVTNGQGLTAARAQRVGQMKAWKWARVSIDAGRRETYCATRSVNEQHWDRAWKAVENLAAARDARGDSEVRVGVGFVTARENHAEIAEFCRRAKATGADNVRLSLRFGPDGNDYYLPGQLDEAERQAAAAKAELDDDRFLVVNLIPERRANQDAAKQDYEPCYSMRLICVIGGDACVYTCCTLAFTPDGKIGDLREQSFEQVWAPEFFRKFSVRKTCAVPCLYEKRNKTMIGIVEGGEPQTPSPGAIHVNYV